MEQPQACWFEDGDIVLMADEKSQDAEDVVWYFRVHTAKLGGDMIEQMRQEQQQTRFDCPAVKLSDRGKDVNTLLDAIYNGLTMTVKRSTFEETRYILTILRLMHEYQLDVAELRNSCIQLLLERWPSEYEKYRAAQQNLPLPRVSEAVEIFIISIKYRIMELLPAALFEISTLKVRWCHIHEELFKSLHQSDRNHLPDGTRNQRNRLQTFIDQYQLEAVEFQEEVIGIPTGSPEVCQRGDVSDNTETSCAKSIREIVLREEENQQFVTLAWFLHQIDYKAFASKESICDGCAQYCAETVEKMLRELWDNIPNDFGVEL